jgi:outer membrane protein assembly factor BamB
VFLGPPTITAGTLQATASNDFGGGTLTFDLRSGAMTGDVFIHHFDEGSIAATLQGVSAYHAAEFVPNGLIVQYAVFGAHRGFIEAVSPPDGAEPVTDPAIVGGHVVLGHGVSVMSFPLERCTPEPSLPPDFCQSEWTTPIGATVTIPAGVSGTRVAVGDGSGTVTVLDITTGAIVWRGHTGSAGLTPPAIAHGTIYVGSSDGHLYAFDADGCGAPQCSPLWSANTVSGVSAQPAVGADVVYVGGADGRVRAFAADGCGRATCPRLWTGVVDHATNPGLVTGPVVTGGRLYAATNTGQLSVFALRAP